MPSHPHSASPGAQARRTILAVLSVVCVAVVGHLAVLKTWWLHDDWIFLADAAGIIDRGGGLARWLSYKGYWALLYPLFGLDPLGWGISRLVMHAASAVLVYRICGRAGVGRAGSWLGGLIFAASPVAFDSLYWGTGAVELLGVFWTLGAVERWLAGGQRNRLYALLLGGAAVMSKESGLLLPIVFAVHLLVQRDRSLLLWSVLVAVGALGALSAAGLVLDIDPATEYGLSVASVPRNLLALGFWLVAPPAWQNGFEWMNPGSLALGGLFWSLWIGAAAWRFRRGDRVCLLAAGAALLSLLPAALLDTHVLPRYAYGAEACLAICLAQLASLRIRVVPVGLLLAVTVGATAGAWGATHWTIAREHPGGRPVHRLVLKEELSRRTCRGIRRIGERGADHVVFLIDPQGDAEETRILRDAIGDTLAVKLLLGEQVQVKWADSLSPQDAGALVVSVRGLNLETRGTYEP